MKANAPEKIYLVETTKIIDEWRIKPSQYARNIEYTRTDAFIEKACDWFSRIDYDYSMPPFETTEEFIDEFRKYMKGE